jgi:hypothetical protein
MGMLKMPKIKKSDLINNIDLLREALGLVKHMFIANELDKKMCNTYDVILEALEKTK